MDKKMKECMKPHALMHTLAGVGVGIVLVSLVPSLNSLLVGLVVVGVAVVLEVMRK